MDTTFALLVSLCLLSLSRELEGIKFYIFKECIIFIDRFFILFPFLFNSTYF